MGSSNINVQWLAVAMVVGGLGVAAAAAVATAVLPAYCCRTFLLAVRRD